ncbi:LADA_0C10990g1_1 [Lachancea dasiensis]|uniref:LADA_0C10990g1_1 n=1 Tax=Lachancea dasiensis TaxID=1072105 RepID=A0A1G4J1E9_9SACH|nr:LADA_0C10990g1_1 [Lachancea dasiensis]
MAGDRHGIRIPGTILDELKEVNYDQDTRFGTNKRRRKQQVGRKEKRKQQRIGKRQKAREAGEVRRLERAEGTRPKRVAGAHQNSQQLYSDDGSGPDDDSESVGSETGDEDEEEEEEEHYEESPEMSVEETMAALKRAKEQKKKKSGSESVKTPSGLKENVNSDQDDDDEDENDSFGGFEDDDVEGEEDDDDNDSEVPEMTVEETMAALKRAKAKKEAILNTSGDQDGTSFDESDDESPEMTVEETMAALKRAKEGKKKSSSSKTEMPVPTAKPSLSPAELAQAQKDQWDYDYYSKKLGIKGKNKNLRANNEFDAIGGLLEGLDFFENYGSDGSESETADEMEAEADAKSGTASETASEQEEGKPFSSDDEISEGDFDEFDENDLDEEEWRQLRELEGKGEGSEAGSEEGSDGSRPTKRENPYVAPTTTDLSAYVPPSLRKQHLLNKDSENVTELKKKVKSALNKLSESNITVIVNSLAEIYESFPRQHVNDALAEQTLDIVCHRDKLLDSFIINYAAVVFSLWKLKGTEVGASFIQAWVEKLLETFQRDQEQISATAGEGKEGSSLVVSKECNNLVGLLAYCYNFGLISCRLIYDVIEMLIRTPNEFSTELLLRIISISGPLIRGDDPKALKEIISELLDNVRSVRQSPRMKFLLEVMSDLKNNRLKPSILAASHANLKKTLTNFIGGASSTSDPLQVTLNDIQNIETRGKWWLVGASWKGNMVSAFEDQDNSNLGPKTPSKKKLVIQDDILDDIPDWSEIARAQRMNTEVRRAIFVSIMSAQDFMDAFTKVEKLNLKNKQSLEIPRVLIHCLAMEGKKGSYNPFYSLLGVKLSQQNHHVAKAFQFMFWDMIKKFEQNDNSDIEDASADEEDLDEDRRLKRITCQGRFFGTLLGEEVLSLDVFKHVPLMGGLDSDGMLFIEILIYQFLLSVAKKCESKKSVHGKKEIRYEGTIFERLIDRSLKLENSHSILAAFNVFLSRNFKLETFMSEPKGTKGHEREERRVKWAYSRFTQLIKEGLKG